MPEEGMVTMGSKEKINVTFLTLVDNPLSENLIFKKNFLCAMAVLDYLAMLKRSLGLAFDAHFLHDFSIKIFLIQFSINEQSFNVTPYFFLKISNKMCY